MCGIENELPNCSAIPRDACITETSEDSGVLLYAELEGAFLTPVAPSAVLLVLHCKARICALLEISGLSGLTAGQTGTLGLIFSNLFPCTITDV